MSIFRYVISLLALLAAATFAAVYVLASCSAPTVTARYEVVAGVRVGQEIARGSAVWEATVKDGPRIFFQMGPTDDVAAEAVEIKLRTGESIFVLRRRANPPQDYLGTSSLAYGAFIRDCIRIDVSDPSYMNVLAQFDGSCTVKATQTLVRFGDPSDPASIEVIAYGPNETVEFLNLSVSETDEPVTNTITRSLPWLLHLDEDDNIRTGKPDGQMPDAYFLRAKKIYALDFKKRHNK